MTDRKQTPMPMPKVAQIPVPPAQPRPNRPAHDVYADEALKSAQRVLDMMQEIDRLGQELEDWRREAMLARAEVKRLEGREAQLTDQLERRTQQLTDERDAYRQRLNHLTSQFHTAGAIILKCLEAANGANTPNINFTALANEVERAESEREGAREVMHDLDPPAADQEAPLPRVVTAGPRQAAEG